jgi:hypothetical protein
MWQVVVNKASHQLPLAVITFASVDETPEVRAYR